MRQQHGRLHVVVVAVWISLSVTTLSPAATVTFTGPGSFGDASKWTGSTLPNFGDDLVINGACTIDASFPSGLSYGTVSMAPASSIVWNASGAAKSLEIGGIADTGGAGTRTIDMTSGGQIVLFGPWSGSNTSFLSGTGRIVISGPGSLPAGVTSFYDLVYSGPTLTLPANTTITGTLTLSAGNIDTGAFTLTFGTNGSLAPSPNGWIIGNVARSFPAGPGSFNFPIGDAGSGIDISVTFANVTAPGTVTASTVPADHPQLAASGINAAKSLNRVWSLVASGLTFTTADISFRYTDADPDPGANVAAMIIKRFSGGTWLDTTEAVPSYPNVGVMGVTGLGAFAAGEAALPLDHFTVTASTPQTAGQAFPVTVTARDVNNNIVTSFAGTVALTAGPAVLAATSNNFVNGVLTQNVTITAAGSHTITAVRNGGSESGTSTAITVNHGPLATFAIAPIGNQASGAVFPITITARDAFGNTATSFTGTVNLTISSATIAPTTSGAFTAGVRTQNVTVTGTPGTKTITAMKSPSGPESGTGTVNITSGPLAQFQFSTIPSQTAGVAFSITISARDASNILVSSFTGPVDISAEVDGRSVPVTPSVSGAFSGGSRTESVQITKAGYARITVSGGGQTKTSSQFLVRPGPIAELDFANIPAAIPIGQFFPGGTLTARDAFGNVASYGGQVAVQITPESLSGTLTPSTVYLTSGTLSLTAFRYSGPRGTTRLKVRAGGVTAYTRAIQFRRDTVLTSIQPTGICRSGLALRGSPVQVSIQGEQLPPSGTVRIGSKTYTARVLGGGTLWVIDIPRDDFAALSTAPLVVTSPEADTVTGSPALTIVEQLSVNVSPGNPFCTTGPTPLRATTNLPDATVKWIAANGSVLASGPAFTINAGSDAAYRAEASYEYCATATAPVTASVLPASIPVTARDGVPANSSKHEASVTPIAGATYRWTISNGSITAGQGTPAITWNALSGGSAVVSVAVSAPGNACTRNGSKTVELVACAGDRPVPALIAPANGVVGVNGVQTFSWSAVPGATEYVLWVAAEQSTFAVTKTTTSTQADVDLPGGNYAWYVRARFGYCPASTSASRQLNVSGDAACTTRSGPAITAPAAMLPSDPTKNILIGKSATLRWNPVAGAQAYVVSYQTSPVYDGEGERWTPLTTLPPTKQTAVTLPVLPTGFVNWRVAALFPDCTATSYSVFTINGCDLVPQPVDSYAYSVDNGYKVSGPHGGTYQSISNRIDMSWTAVPFATGYMAHVFGKNPSYLPASKTSSYIWLDDLDFPTAWKVQVKADGCDQGQFFGGYYAEVEYPVARTKYFATDCDEAGGAAANTLWTDHVFTPPVRGPKAVTFYWHPAGKATTQLLLSRNDGPFQEVGGFDRSSYKPDEFFQLKTLDLPPGRYRWTVWSPVETCEYDKNHNLICYVCLHKSEEKSFTLENPACPVTTAPYITAPNERALIFGTPLRVAWTTVSQVTDYQLRIYRKTTTGKELVREIDTKAVEVTDLELPEGDYTASIGAVTASGCAVPERSERSFRIRTRDCVPPSISGPALVDTGVPYQVRWDAVGRATPSYTIIEATNPDFTSGYSVIRVTNTTVVTRTKTNPGIYYYRVRADSESCAAGFAERLYSRAIAVGVAPPSKGFFDFSGNIARGATRSVVLQFNNGEGLRAPGPSSHAADPIRITPNVPWMTITPDGPIGPNEPFQVTVDPTLLPIGTNTGYFTITGGGRSAPEVKPFVINIVPDALSDPPEASGGGVIVPVVSRARGASAEYRSDLLLSNQGSAAVSYRLTFSPAGGGAPKHTTLDLEPGEVVAFRDVVQSLFGETNGAGWVEVTTVSGSIDSTQFASRSYSAGPAGGFGEFVPVVPISELMSSDQVLRIPLVKQSGGYRTNLGLIETSGVGASAMVSVFDPAGAKIGEIPFSLQANQHHQFNSFLAANGLSLENGRLEIRSTGGRIGAYASIVDGRSGDALIVDAVRAGGQLETDYVVAGVSDVPGQAGVWRSDLYISNHGTETVTAHLRYFALGEVTPRTADVELAPGAMRVLADVLPMTLNAPSTAGVLHVVTDAASSLDVRATTYSDGATRSGQWIVATPARNARGKSDGALQLLGAERSADKRSNIGIAEVTGKPATVEVRVIAKDGQEKSAVAGLEANELRQFSPFALVGWEGNASDVRVTIRVIAGEGKIAGYLSLIDNHTNDASYQNGR